MWTRRLALVATAWAGAYLVAYLAVVHQGGDAPAWWYIGLVVIGIAAAIAAAGGWFLRPALVISAVVFGLAALLGLLTIGVLLLPSFVCVIVGSALLKSAPSTAVGPQSDNAQLKQ